MVSTALVFFMHLGFSFLEIGLTRQKNTINILFKNIFIICAGLLLYYVAGFNLMYPGDLTDTLDLLVLACHFQKMDLPRITPQEATPTGQTSCSRACLPPQLRPLYLEPLLNA